MYIQYISYVCMYIVHIWLHFNIIVLFSAFSVFSRLYLALSRNLNQVLLVILPQDGMLFYLTSTVSPRSATSLPVAPSARHRSKAVCTSLAPVPGNPFLVWASIPLSNAVLLWDVRELQLLFTLPFSTHSICVPAGRLPLSLNASGNNNSASIESSPSLPRRWRQSVDGQCAQLNPQLLCVLATGKGDSGDGDDPGRSGCGLLGVCLEGADGCASSGVTAIQLEGDKKSSLPKNTRSNGRR